MDLETAIDRVLAARRDERSELRVGEAASSLQEPVTSWYESSQSLKERLFEYGGDHPDDRDDVNARIAALRCWTSRSPLISASSLRSMKRTTTNSSHGSRASRLNRNGRCMRGTLGSARVS